MGYISVWLRRTGHQSMWGWVGEDETEKADMPELSNVQMSEGKESQGQSPLWGKPG